MDLAERDDLDAGGRRSEVELYRAGDVDALLDLPGVDWHAVRTCGKGEPSPLRAFVSKLPPSRSEVVRRWIARLGDRFGVDVWAVHRKGGDSWEIDWDTRDGRPTKAEAAIADDPVIAQYRGDLVLAARAGLATRWARSMLEPGAAVILDTGTTDLWGPVIEIAWLAAASQGRKAWAPAVHAGGADRRVVFRVRRAVQAVLAATARPARCRQTTSPTRPPCRLLRRSDIG